VTPGDPLFHEIGYDFTWALRSRVKDSFAVLTIVDRKSGTKSMQRPFPELAQRGSLRVANDPYLIWRAAQAAAAGRDVAVYATSAASVNGGKVAQLVDPETDLTRVSFPRFGVPSWVRLRDNADNN
jgi:hypothetical protein